MLELVDAHTHVHPTAAAAQSLRGGLSHGATHSAGDVADALATMDRLGVTRSLLLPLVHARRDHQARVAAGEDAGVARSAIAAAWSDYNRWAVELARERPERFAATVGVDPILLGAAWARDEIERGVAAGAVGIKIMPAFIGVAPDDPRLAVVWEQAERHGVAVVSQSGRTPYTDVGHPDRFAAVAREHPGVRIVLAHIGLGAEERTVALTNRFENVFVDTSAWFNVRLDPGSWVNAGAGAAPPTLDAAAQLLRRIGVDRVLFGTNYALRDPGPAHDALRRMPLSDDERALIASGNYRRVYAAG